MRSIVVCCTLLTACATGGSPDLAADASVHMDGGRIGADAGLRDANVMFVDSSMSADSSVVDSSTFPRDAGTSPRDAGTSPHDAGTSPHDAGTSPRDAGECSCASGCRAVHRSVNPNNGVHLYTLDRAEASRAPWVIEVENYFFLHEAGGPGLQEFHRCGLQTGSYFYTQSPTCEGAPGAVHQGVLGWVASSPLCDSTPLYRLVGRPGHFYTVNATERNTAIASGFTDENIAGHVWTR